MSHIELIARVLVVKNEKILLCKTVKEGHYFLPGGHVEFGERAERTLVREMEEEAHAVVSDLNYIGIFENGYGEGEERHHEINILFSGSVANEHVISAEAHITFEWISIVQFAHIKFLPKIFVHEILKHLTTANPIYLTSLNDI